MRIVFASPGHENGGCIFADPTQTSTAYEPSCPIVFARSEHENGGCIFADPRQADERARRGGGGGYDFGRIWREDEEILAVIIASSRTVH